MGTRDEGHKRKSRSIYSQSACRIIIELTAPVSSRAAMSAPLSPVVSMPNALQYFWFHFDGWYWIIIKNFTLLTFQNDTMHEKALTNLMWRYHWYYVVSNATAAYIIASFTEEKIYRPRFITIFILADDYCFE